MKITMDFLKEYGIIVAGILALGSFLLINWHAQQKAKDSERDIKDKIDAAVEESVEKTLGEMKAQFGYVIEDIEAKAKLSMQSIDDQGGKIIDNLITSSIEINSNLDRIKDDTQRIADDLNYREAVLRVEFKIENYKEELDNSFLNRATEYIISEHSYELGVNGMIYNWNYTQMERALEYGLILEAKTNTYFINSENISFGGENAIIVTFRLERLAKSKKDLNSMEDNYSYLVFTSRFRPKFGNRQNESTDSFTQIVVPSRCFVQFTNENTWREFTFDHKVNTGGYQYTGETMIFKKK